MYQTEKERKKENAWNLFCETFGVMLQNSVEFIRHVVEAAAAEL